MWIQEGSRSWSFSPPSIQAHANRASFVRVRRVVPSICICARASSHTEVHHTCAWRRFDDHVPSRPPSHVDRPRATRTSQPWISLDGPYIVTTLVYLHGLSGLLSTGDRRSSRRSRSGGGLCRLVDRLGNDGAHVHGHVVLRPCFGPERACFAVLRTWKDS